MKSVGSRLVLALSPCIPPPSIAHCILPTIFCLPANVLHSSISAATECTYAPSVLSNGIAVWCAGFVYTKTCEQNSSVRNGMIINA